MTNSNRPFVSIIIVNYNGLQYTRHCLESLFRFYNPNSLEVIVVDNNSSDGSQSELPKLFPSLNFIAFLENKGFATANNAGAKIANGEFLFFVNNDTLFLEETIEKLKKILLLKNEYGIIGPKLLNEDRTFQLSFGNFPSIKNEFDAKNLSLDYSIQLKEDIISDLPIAKDWVTGAAIMIEKKLFESIGGFDEQFFMYFEDIDLCKRLNRIGYSSHYIPSVNMIHLGGKSYVTKNGKIVYEYRRSQLRYYDKHNSVFQRMAVRIYIIFKFLPKMFNKTDKKLSLDILKLIFSSHN